MCWTSSRTHRVKVGATTVSEYAYLGSRHVVGTELPQPDVFSRRLTGASAYGELDQFNRPITWTWTKDLTTDVPFYDVEVAYDESGKISQTEDNVDTAGAAGSGKVALNTGVHGIDEIVGAIVAVVSPMATSQ